jgi:excinuclease ABC subunit C
LLALPALSDMPARAVRGSLGKASSALREHVRSKATARPAVYWMSAPDGEVLYVGKSKRLRTRLLSYFRGTFADDKAARIISVTQQIDWTYVPSEFAALLEEMRRIKQLRPRFNVALKRDARHYAFIKIGGGVAPRLMVVRGPTGDHSAIYYGPFVGAVQLGDSLRELSDVLGLRDCTHDRKMRFSDQRELFALPPRTPGCIRFEIGKCLGPCIAACSAANYSARVSLARAFLEGRNDGPLDALRDDMSASAERLEFERAANLRDKLQRLEHLRAQFERLRFAVEDLSFLYTVPGAEGDDRVYVIRHGVVRDERPKPRTARQRRELRELASALFGSGGPSGGAVPTHEIDELMVVSSWFRNHPAEMKQTRLPTAMALPASPRQLE